MLSEIVANRKKQVARNKELYPIKLLETSIYFESPCVSLKHYILRADKSGIIAEFKRKSPSKGILNQYAEVVETTISYMQAGASALSVLTEPDYFMGKDDDLKQARFANFCPILRKDFIFDEYQIIETKSLGADIVLLIAACLDTKELLKLYNLAKQLGLEILFEIHHEDDLKKIPGDDVIIGVNNRNLTTMETDIETSLTMADKLSKDFVLVSESGLKSSVEIIELKKAGYSGFLMGEQFMKFAKPQEAIKQIITELNKFQKCS